MRVLRLLHKYHDGSEPSFGKYLTSGEMATFGDEDDFQFQWLNSQVKKEL